MKKLFTFTVIMIVALMMLGGPAFAYGKKVGIQLQRLLVQEKQINHTNYKSFSNKLVSLRLNKQKEVMVSVLIKADLRAVDKIVKAGAQINTVLSNGIMTANVPLRKLRNVAAVAEIEEIELGQRVKMYTDISVPSSSGIGLNLTRAGAPTGSGVIAAAVDSGIDYTHNDFRHGDGTTRILAIWDQSDYSDSDPPSGYTYGCEYTATEINSSLTSGVPLGQEDADGHGTHVMGTIAGNHTQYMGVAPEADIIMVKFDFDGDRNTTAAIIDGINYIFTKATSLSQPAVVNLSLGTDYGPHDGSTLEERSMDALTGAGKIVVVAAGNAARNLGSANKNTWGDPIHGDGTITEGGSSIINITIPTYTSTSGADYIFFDAWYRGGDICQVQITTPKGKKYPPNFSGSNKNVWKTGSAGSYYATSEGSMLVFNASPGDPLGWGDNNADSELYIEISDYATGIAPKKGSWKIQIYDRGGTVTNGTYNSWQGASDSLLMSSFLYEGQNPDSVMTVGSPATANQVLTIGAYTTRLCWDYLGGISQQCYSVGPLAYYDAFYLNDLAYFSSRGPTRDGRTKPDISAPGVGIVAALSTMLNAEQVDYFYNHNRVVPDGIHAILQGTSMACPHGSGSVALLLAMDPTLDPADVKNLLTTTATVDTYTGTVPNYNWGYGKINLDAALAP